MLINFVSKVSEFLHDANLIARNGVNSGNLLDAYRFMAPMIDTDVYMRWLFKEVQSAGCGTVQQRITQPLLDCEDALKDRYRADWIINCSGPWADRICQRCYHSWNA